MSVVSASWTAVTNRYPQNTANLQVTTTSTELEKQWQSRIDDLLAFRRYRDDWDSTGSAAPDSVLIDLAVRFVKQWQRQTPESPPSACSISPDGNILIMWQNPGDYTEVEVTGDGTAEWMRKHGGRTEFWSQSLRKGEIGSQTVNTGPAVSTSI